MSVWWKKILAFLFPDRTLTGREWYKLLDCYFQPPKAHMSWMQKRDGLEINWRQAKSNLLETE